MFGKLENGVLIFAPKRLTVDGKVHYNPVDEMYLQLGYLPIEERACPEKEDVIFAPVYEEQDGKIVKTWVEVEPKEEEKTPTVEDRLLTVETELAATMEAVDVLIMGGDLV